MQMKARLLLTNGRDIARRISFQTASPRLIAVILCARWLGLYCFDLDFSKANFFYLECCTRCQLFSASTHRTLLIL